MVYKQTQCSMHIWTFSSNEPLVKSRRIISTGIGKTGITKYWWCGQSGVVHTALVGIENGRASQGDSWVVSYKTEEQCNYHITWKFSSWVFDPN